MSARCPVCGEIVVDAGPGDVTCCMTEDGECVDTRRAGPGYYTGGEMSKTAILSMLGITDGPEAPIATVRISFPCSGDLSWATEAVRLVREHRLAWSWMNVEANARRGRQDRWYSLTLHGMIGDARVEVDGPGGWDGAAAVQLHRRLEDARDENDYAGLPPFTWEGARPMAY